MRLWALAWALLERFEAHPSARRAVCGRFWRGLAGFLARFMRSLPGRTWLAQVRRELTDTEGLDDALPSEEQAPFEWLRVRAPASR